MIVVAYGSERLRECCLGAEAAEQAFGQAHAQAVLSLIADIEALAAGNELIEFYGSAATVHLDDSLSIDIGANCSARFVAAGGRVRRDGDERIVWASVQRLKLIAIDGC